MAIKSRSTTITDIPPELLHQIFSQIEASDLQSVSLVSRLFCSISSALVYKLTFSTEPPSFQRLFSRFPVVNTVRICIVEFDSALVTILDSELNLETLQLGYVRYPSPSTLKSVSASRNVLNIRSLQFAWFYTDTKEYVCSTRVHEFIELFRSVNELDFSGSQMWNDEAIERVVLSFPDLRGIKLDTNSGLTDKTLAIITSNCSNLETVSFQLCYKMTPHAFFSFWSSKPGLKSLDMPPISKPFVDASPIFSNCIQSGVGKNLNHLSVDGYRRSLDGYHIKNVFISALAKSRPTLKSLELGEGFTMESVSELLSICPGLERLVISIPSSRDFKTKDVQMSKIVKTLPCLKYIKIYSSHTCNATLFSLVQHCRLLETIHLLSDKKMSNQAIPRPTSKNYSIRSVDIMPDSDIWLHMAIKFYCPNAKLSPSVIKPHVGDGMNSLIQKPEYCCRVSDSLDHWNQPYQKLIHYCHKLL